MTDLKARGLNRNQRRVVIANEERRRKTGDWGPWERVEVPNGGPGDSWLRSVRVAHRNQVFAVLVRDAGGGVTHYAISSGSGVRPTWWEMQRIKNELAGEQATAVEVYPPQAEVVDGADMFHFWVMPEALPFSLWGAK